MKKRNVVKFLAVVSSVAALSGISLKSVNADAATVTSVPTRITMMAYNGQANSRGWNWITNRSVDKNYVEVIKVDNDKVDLSSIDWDKATKIEATNDDFYSGYRAWKASMEDMEYNAYYAYRCGNDGKWTDGNTIYIDDGNDGMSFYHITDPQGYSESDYEAYLRSLRLMHQDLGNVTSIICTGDFSQQYKSPECNINEWGYVLEGAKDYLRNTMITAVPGNHDQCAGFYSAQFNAKLDENCNTKMGFYYSYTIGDVHFVLLNTNDVNTDGHLSTAQMEWLENDLKNNNSTWTIMASHKSPYTTGRHVLESEIQKIRESVFPIITKYKIDMYLEGHDHVYARTNAYSWDGDGMTTNDSYETTTRIINNNKYTFGINAGTYYVIPNTIAAHSANLSPITATDLLPEYFSIATSEVNGLFLNTQPNLPMFGHIHIKDGYLLYQAYEINAEDDIILYDYFGLSKNNEKTVSSKIEKLPEKYNTSSIEAIIDAKKAYDSLADEEKALISEDLTKKLNSLAKYVSVSDYNEASFVKAMIDSLGSVRDSEEFGKKLSDIEQAYSSLTNIQKTYVSNYATFENKKFQYACIDDADAVIKLIDAVNDEASRIAARNAYNALSEDAKARVTNYSKLARIEAEAGIYNEQ